MTLLPVVLGRRYNKWLTVQCGHHAWQCSLGQNCFGEALWCSQYSPDQCMVPALASICLLSSRPLLDNTWQYVPGGGFTAMSVGTCVSVHGGRTMSTALKRSRPADSLVAWTGMHAWSDRHWMYNVSLSTGIDVDSDGGMVLWCRCGWSVSWLDIICLYPATCSAHCVEDNVDFGRVNPASSNVICVATLICLVMLSRN